MKTTFIIFFLCCSACSKQFPTYAFNIWNEVISPFSAECAIKANISLNYINNMINDGTIPNEVKFNKYLTCIYKNLGYFKDDGNFNMEPMLDILYVNEKLMTKCVEKANAEKDQINKSHVLGSCVVISLSG